MKTAAILLIAFNVSGAFAAKGPEQFRRQEAELFRREEAECPKLRRKYGCDKESCWTACGQDGSDQWCWMADDGGYGPWIKCKTHEECSWSNLARKYGDVGCGIGANCPACGCGC
ncbi:hypothetical protein HJFPF1_02206 [Paramyrothecium foliicola]|nr:hypothetical protein HJFPF1_02206 [Paramyrothecium foliicola]